MSRVAQTIQQMAALAESNDADRFNALINELVPGEFDEIADVLRTMGKSDQAETMLKIKARRMSESLTDGQRAIADAAGMTHERYAELYAETVARYRR